MRDEDARCLDGLGPVEVGHAERARADLLPVYVLAGDAKRAHDFFRPLSKPLRALPFAVDDLDNSVQVLGELARADGVRLLLPTLWQCEDPWR